MKVSKGRPAGRLLELRLREQVEALVLHETGANEGAEDGVHQLRVACRRLRGALGTFRPLVDRDVTDPLREELRWLAQSLGGARDAEVVLARLRAALEEEPEVNVVGPVTERIEQTYLARLAVAGRAATEVLCSPRHQALVGALHRLVDEPPFTEDADAPARDVMLPRVERDWKRLRDRVRLLDGVLLDAPERDELLHDVRKAAKRLRYACETLEPVWGTDARALRKAAQEVTRVLGERQDGAVARAELRVLGLDAHAAGESAFTYGLLLAREEERQTRSDDDWDEVWEVARDRELRAWLG